MIIHKTKIEWASHTWNPVTGCLHGCEYCYARRFTMRFQPHAVERPMVDDNGSTGILEEPDSKGCYVVCWPVKLVDEKGQYIRKTHYPKEFSPTFRPYILSYPESHHIPSRIFVSSMGDLFGDWVPDIWIEQVFLACKKAPQHSYLFLTKNPGRYFRLVQAGKLPSESNFFYGTTITKADQEFFCEDGYNTFLSIEPLLGEFTADMWCAEICRLSWAIIGAMTGPGSKKHQPKREWVQAIVNKCADAGVPVFMKDSLESIWGHPLIRQHPSSLVWPEKE